MGVLFIASALSLSPVLVQVSRHKQQKTYEERLMKQTRWLQQKTARTSSYLNMSNQSNKDLTGLWGQGHASYLK